MDRYRDKILMIILSNYVNRRNCVFDLGYFLSKANSKNNEDKIKRYIVESHA